MDRHTLSIFGIRILTWERLRVDLEDSSILSNTGGNFEIAPGEVEEEEWEEESCYQFGFRPTI